MSDTIDLGDFEGKPVLVTSVAVTNAGDGLSEALGIDPQILHQGDRGAILLEYEVAKVRFEPVKDTNGLSRVHVLKAKTGTLMDLEEASERLDAQRRRIEEASGTLQLPLDDEGEPRGGEPQSIGDVLNEGLDAAIGLAEDAEDDETWRDERRSQLETWTKDALRTELEDEHHGSAPSKATHAELVDLVLDHEAFNRG